MYTIRPDAVHSIWLSMSQALDYIHSRSIRHCDVKPENIFLKPDGKNAVLCDFGHAVAHPLAKNEKTLCYIPSEFLYRKSSSAGNVWALGVTMLYVAGLMPLPNRSWIIAHIGKGVNAEPEMKQWFLEIAEITKKIPEHLSLLRKMLKSDSRERITAKYLTRNLNVSMTVSEDMLLLNRVG